VKEDVLEIDDRKLEHLSSDEVEQAIEVVVRDWASSGIEAEWETLDEEQQLEE